MADSIAVRTRPYRASSRDGGSRQLTDARRPWAEAVLCSAVLSLLFVFVYGECNALASRRTDLGTCFFAWELRIPFVPALIVPYMSIDLFFVASFLLCADRIELRAHTQRIVATILVAGLAFLVFPLTAGYPRPEVSGWAGPLFGLLRSFDKPHNLVPSLHVALASLLWAVYARHTPPNTHGSLRWFVHLWFTLIIASPLFTWQHHLLDVVTGAMLGQVCMFVFPGLHEHVLVRSASANFRVARLYAAGSAVLGILAIALGSWFWLLAWPAASLALIAIAYARGNSSVFRKSGGRFPISTRVVLGPYLFGAYVSLLIYRRRGEPWVEAAPGVYCGRLLTKREARAVRSMGVTGVLDLTAEHAETRAFLGLDYLNVPVLDLTAPSREQSDVAVDFIAEHAHSGGVYVHCALGISRSIAAVAAYIASREAEPHPAPM
jgi:protein-tyrosine phosphatase/membrane-associated phospholipid phosphatase